MKKYILLLLVSLLIITIPASAFAGSNQAVFTVGSNIYLVNRAAHEMDAIPFIDNDRTFVPVRYLASALDVPIYWNEFKRRVEMPAKGSEDASIIVLYEGDKNIYIESPVGTNGLPDPIKPMDVAPVLKNDRIYLPARYIAEIYDYQVDWDPVTQSVLIGTPGNMPQPAKNEPTAFSVSSRKITINNESLNVDMEVPQINGLTNGLFQEQLNNQIMSAAQVVKDEIETLARDYPMEFGPYIAVINYNTYVNKDLLAIIVETYMYAGGAHGMSYLNCYNIDTKNNKVLELKDLFADGIDYKGVINQYIKNEIDSSLQKGEPVYFDGFTSIADNQNFYVKNNSIVICFGEYEIAPYSSGKPEFALPVGLFEEYLNDSFMNLIN
jgi:hypothetical protein